MNYREQVMEVVKDSPDGILAQDIADATDLTRTQVGYALNYLVNHGAVSREPCEVDLRQMVYRPTGRPVARKKRSQTRNRSSPTAGRVYEHIQSVGGLVTAGDIAESCGLSITITRRALVRLEKEGKVKRRTESLNARCGEPLLWEAVQ